MYVERNVLGLKWVKFVSTLKETYIWETVKYGFIQTHFLEYTTNNYSMCKYDLQGSATFPSGANVCQTHFHTLNVWCPIMWSLISTGLGYVFRSHVKETMSATRYRWRAKPVPFVFFIKMTLSSVLYPSFKILVLLPRVSRIPWALSLTKYF